jgi:endonuclease/exonuclease/phosphatase (EEP) superfamily protein YafD
LSAATVGTAQATELVHGPLATGLPVVLTCDCNAAPGSATYTAFTGAGLQDSWMQAQTGEPGYTCCQNPALLNPASTLAARIDNIFNRGGGLTAGDAEVVGADPGDRTTPSGFWRSDHAGLFAELQQN